MVVPYSPAHLILFLRPLTWLPSFRDAHLPSGEWLRGKGGETGPAWSLTYSRRVGSSHAAFCRASWCPCPCFPGGWLEMISDVVIEGFCQDQHPRSPLSFALPLNPPLYHIDSQPLPTPCLPQHLSKVTCQVQGHLSEPADTQIGLTLHH